MLDDGDRSPGIYAPSLLVRLEILNDTPLNIGASGVESKPTGPRTSGDEPTRTHQAAARRVVRRRDPLTPNSMKRLFEAVEQRKRSLIQLVATLRVGLDGLLLVADIETG